MAQHDPIREAVVVVNFSHDGEAYQAMTRLRELDSQGLLHVRAAAVVSRAQDGRIAVKDQVGENELEGTAVGGVLGLLIGVLAGPLGVLIGGATGLLIGSLFDIEDQDDTRSILSDISRSVRVGHTALLAQITEQNREVFDTAMGKLEGTVLRRPVADVEAEIAAAEDAQRAAKKKARKQLRKQRHDEHEEEAHTKVQDLKAKLHHGEPAGTAS